MTGDIRETDRPADATFRAERETPLGRLWAAASPPEPDWDGLWARVSQALDASELTRHAPAVLPMPAGRRPRNAWVVAVLGLAQAAAVVAGVSLALRQGPPAPGPEVSQAEPVRADFEIETGDVTLIRVGANRGVRAVVLAQEGPTNGLSGGLDRNFDMLNAFESIAE